MFDRTWAKKNQEDSIELSMLPYFVEDAASGELVEMTNCTPERKKSLGWYDIVFINNQGNRANTYYEDIHTVRYNSVRDEVECLSFRPKVDWKELIYARVERVFKDSKLYIEDPARNDPWIEKIKAYFMSDKYDPDQLDVYRSIFERLSGDAITYFTTPTYETYNQIIAFEVYAGLRQKEHLLHYIEDNISSLIDKKIVATGANAFIPAIALKKHGISVKVLDNVFYPPGEGIFHIAIGAVLAAINNDVYIEVIEIDDYDYRDDDVLIFDSAFRPECAEKNWALATSAKRANKTVLICSPTVWDGTSPFLSIPADQKVAVYEYEGDVVFTPA